MSRLVAPNPAAFGALPSTPTAAVGPSAPGAPRRSSSTLPQGFLAFDAPFFARLGASDSPTTQQLNASGINDHGSLFSNNDSSPRVVSFAQRVTLFNDGRREVHSATTDQPKTLYRARGALGPLGGPRLPRTAAGPVSEAVSSFRRLLGSKHERQEDDGQDGDDEESIHSPKPKRPTIAQRAAKAKARSVMTPIKVFDNEDSDPMMPPGSPEYPSSVPVAVQSSSSSDATRALAATDPTDEGVLRIARDYIARLDGLLAKATVLDTDILCALVPGLKDQLMPRAAPVRTATAAESLQDERGDESMGDETESEEEKEEEEAPPVVAAVPVQPTDEVVPARVAVSAKPLQKLARKTMSTPVFPTNSSEVADPVEMNRRCNPNWMSEHFNIVNTATAIAYLANCRLHHDYSPTHESYSYYLYDSHIAAFSRLFGFIVELVEWTIETATNYREYREHLSDMPVFDDHLIRESCTRVGDCIELCEDTTYVACKPRDFETFLRFVLEKGQVEMRCNFKITHGKMMKFLAFLFGRSHSFQSKTSTCTAMFAVFLEKLLLGTSRIANLPSVASLPKPGMPKINIKEATTDICSLALFCRGWMRACHAYSHVAIASEWRTVCKK